MRFFASCGKGLEYLLVDELIALGCKHATATTAGANVEGTLADAQRAVMWSRLASRILWPIAEFDCADEHALYAGASMVDWTQHVAPRSTIAVDARNGGLGTVLAGRRPDTRVGDDTVGDGQLVVVLQDAHRHDWQRNAASRLVGEAPDAIVVELGLPAGGRLGGESVEPHTAGRLRITQLEAQFRQIGAEASFLPELALGGLDGRLALLHASGRQVPVAAARRGAQQHEELGTGPVHDDHDLVHPHRGASS